MENLSFETIRQLSARFIDFLVLISSGMDANRNVAKYSKEQNQKVARFLGLKNWRDAWSIAEGKGETFERFIRDQFGQQIARLGYIYTGVEDKRPIRLPEKNVLLYRLAFFSRSQRGTEFWNQTRKYSDDQRSFF
jgi:three-Cys-motif partner protein